VQWLVCKSNTKIAKGHEALEGVCEVMGLLVQVARPLALCAERNWREAPVDF
jgi:hypothetical protein